MKQVPWVTVSPPPQKKRLEATLKTDTTSGKVHEWNLAGPGSIRTDCIGQWEEAKSSSSQLSYSGSSEEGNITVPDANSLNVRVLEFHLVMNLPSLASDRTWHCGLVSETKQWACLYLPTPQKEAFPQKPLRSF